METPSPYTEFGIKGMGEGGAIAPPAVIFNAVTMRCDRSCGTHGDAADPAPAARAIGRAKRRASRERNA